MAKKLSKHKQKLLERKQRAANRRITLPEHFEQIPMTSWYPGHMLKAQREMKDKLKLVDVVIELVDARIPATSLNPQFDPIFQNKPRLVVLNKCSLAEESMTQRWLDYFASQGREVIAVDCLSRGGLNSVLPKLHEMLSGGTKKVFRLTSRCMIVGVPNVGKSTFINRLARKKIAETGPRPGVTRRQQWVMLDKDFELLDTPGVLYPRISTKADELNLSLTAGMKDQLVGVELTAEYLLFRLRERGLLNRISGLDWPADESLEYHEIIQKLGDVRGFLEEEGVVDMNKSAGALLQLFREGKLARMTLNTPEEMDEVKAEAAAKLEADKKEAEAKKKFLEKKKKKSEGV